MPVCSFLWLLFSLLLVVPTACGSTAPTLLARATYLTVPSASPSLYTSPQIWVARGLVDCGPSLYAEPCTSTVFTTTSIYVTVDVSWETVTLVWATTQYHSLPPSVTGDRFSPRIIATSFAAPTNPTTASSILVPRNWYQYITPVASIRNFESIPAAIQRFGSAFPTDPPKRLPPDDRYLMGERLPLQRRTDYDICFGIPQGSDFKTNSLAAVCDFVYNLQDSFVSLAPTEAAFMPSWFDFLVSFLIILVSTAVVLTPLLSLPHNRVPQTEPDADTDTLPVQKNPGFFMLAFTAISLGFASIRMAFAVYRIQKHAHSLDSLPYITPLLWADWIPLFTIWRGRLRYLAAFMILALWVLSAWLFIGYGFLKYGTRQYEVLEMSSKCQGIDALYAISWQTDPRRLKFIDLHWVFFIVEIIPAFSLLIWGLAPVNSRLAPAEVATVTNIPEDHLPAHSREALNHTYYVLGVNVAGLLLNLVVLVILAAGLIMTGVLNDAEYLLLVQNGCYASYVSTRTSFLGVDFRDWPAKVGAWLGMTV